MRSYLLISVYFSTYYNRTKDPQDAVERWVKTDKVFHPNQEAHEKYRKLFERWNDVYAEFMHIVNKGLLTPMWRAPGT